MSTIAAHLIRFESNKRSLSVAFAFCLFFGMLGLHRFYLGKEGTAWAMFILTIAVIGTPITLVWTLVDMFLIGNMVKEHNNALADNLEQRYKEED
ncbi:hypothetical protein AGMMS4956_01490 [Bacteroidia bacterium]|nr:hypothetical protein AGMMS4956_01490 [Bacteroidia bacterium]